MLTKQLAISYRDFRHGRIMPDRLTRGTHAQYVELAEQMLAIYHAGIGRTRRELHQEVFTLFRREQGCPQRRAAAFCKLLDDAGAFQDQPRAGASAMRCAVMRLAAENHPLWQRKDMPWAKAAEGLKRRIAEQLGCT